MPKQCLFVLGMHRSGTSLATRLYNMAGASIPGDVLPANPDNPSGYWESRDLVSLNNSLLNAAGHPWHDHRALPDAVLADPVARERIGEFLSSATAGTGVVVLKDPRLCRLLPLWTEAAAGLGAQIRVTLMIRDPLCVADSLRRRDSNPAFRKAAMIDPARIDLLWSRYTLEAEYYSRDHTRIGFDYEDAAKDPVGLLSRSIDALRLDLPAPLSDETRKAVRAFADPDSARSRSPGFARSDLPLSSGTYSRFGKYSIELDNRDLRQQLDTIHKALTDVATRFGNADTPPTAAPAYAPVAARIADRTRRKLIADEPLSFRHVTFISGYPRSSGHIYRVANRVASLQSADIAADVIPASELTLTSVDEGTDAVIVFRCAASDPLEAVREQSRKRGIPWVVDFDDLIFDPDKMNPTDIHFLAHETGDASAKWRADAEKFAATVRAADFAWASTGPLAAAFTRFGVPSTIVPNGIAPGRLAAAAAVRRERENGIVRIGYASGNRTHLDDFEQVAPAIAELLRAHENLRFVALGCLDIDYFEILKPCRSQIERRKLVPFDDLPTALASFDINLAPLVRGNAFCEAKSELKYFEAALVGVPTVATATEPFCAAIEDGETGLLVEKREQWVDRLAGLIADSDEQARIGNNARAAAVAKFGPASQTEDVLVALHALAN